MLEEGSLNCQARRWVTGNTGTSALIFVVLATIVRDTDAGHESFFLSCRQQRDTSIESIPEEPIYEGPAYVEAHAELDASDVEVSALDLPYISALRLDQMHDLKTLMVVEASTWYLLLVSSAASLLLPVKDAAFGCREARAGEGAHYGEVPVRGRCGWQMHAGPPAPCVPCLQPMRQRSWLTGTASLSAFTSKHLTIASKGSFQEVASAHLDVAACFSQTETIRNEWDGFIRAGHNPCCAACSGLRSVQLKKPLR